MALYIRRGRSELPTADAKSKHEFNISTSYNGIVSPLRLGGYLPGPLSTSSIKGKRAGISVFLFFVFAFSFSLRCVPPSPQKRKPVRVFQVFTEWERWSRWTRRDTQGGSLVCSHCIISVHNKRIISRWTTPLPSHLGWELDCNKQPSPLYRSSTSNDALIETQTVYCAVFDGSTEWLSSRNSPQRLFFYCAMVTHCTWLTFYRLHFVLVVAAVRLTSISLQILLIMRELISHEDLLIVWLYPESMFCF